MAYRLPILRPVKELEDRISPDSYGINPTQYDEMPGTTATPYSGDIGFGALPEPPRAQPQQAPDYTNMAPGYNPGLPTSMPQPPQPVELNYGSLGPAQWEGYGAAAPDLGAYPPEPEPEPRPGFDFFVEGFKAGMENTPVIQGARQVGEFLGEPFKNTVFPYLLGGDDIDTARQRASEYAGERQAEREAAVQRADLSSFTDPALDYPGLQGLGMLGTLKPSVEAGLRLGGKALGEAAESGARIAGDVAGTGKLRLGQLATDEAGAIRIGKGAEEAGATAKAAPPAEVPPIKPPTAAGTPPEEPGLPPFKLAKSDRALIAEEKRARAGLADEMQGKPLPKDTPTETVAEIERKAKGPTLEERAAMPRNIQQAIYRPADFEETARNQIVQLQPDYHANLADKVFEASQSVPVLRSIMQFADPAAAAVGRSKKGDPIPLAMAKRDAYTTVEGDAARASVLDWVGRNREVLGIDGKGFARNVEIKPAAKLLKPEGAVQRLDDIMENMASYNLTPEQTRAMTEIKHTFDAMLDAQLKAGIDIHEAKDYWGRIVTKTPKQVDVKVKLKGHTKARSFEGVQEGIAAGYTYADPITALQERLTHGVESIANKKSMDFIKSLGETPTERFKLSKEGQELIAGAQDAKKKYMLTRDLAKKGEASKKELTLAKKEFKQATQTLNRQKLVIGRARAGEMEAYGRIYSPEVKKSIDAYRVTEPGMIDQAFAIERASMVTGDFSQALVQGINMLNRRPDLWVKAMGYSLASTVRAPESYIVKNIDLITDGIRAGAISAPKEFMLAEGGKIPQMIAKAPVVKQTQRAFEWFALVGQAEMWRAVKGMEKTGAAKAELASSVRKSMGVVTRYGLTAKQQGIEKAVAFAPRFTIAFTTLMTDALRGGIRGEQARKTVGAVMAGGTAITIAGQLATTGKMPNLTDPEQKNWMSIDSDAGTVNVFGPYYPYMRAFAQMATRTANGDNEGALQAATVLARGKASLRFGPMIDFWMGETATGYPVKTGTQGIFDAYISRVGPIGPKQIIEHGQKVASGENLPMPAVAGELFGLRTSPYTLSQRKNTLRDEIAESQHGQKWADLEPELQKEVSEDKRLQEATLKIKSTNQDKPLSSQMFDEQNQIDQAMRSQLPEATRKEIERLAVNVGVARSGEGYRYNDERYEHYQSQTVKLASDVLPQLLASDAYKKADATQQKKMMERVVTAVRAEAKLTVDKMTAVPSGAAKNVMAYESFKEAGDETKASFAKLPGLPKDMTLSEVGKTLNVAPNTDIPLSYDERAELQRNRYKYIEELYNKVTASASYKKLTTDAQRKDVIEQYVTAPAGERARLELRKKLGTPEIKRRIEEGKKEQGPPYKLGTVTATPTPTAQPKTSYTPGYGVVR